MSCRLHTPECSLDEEILVPEAIYINELQVTRMDSGHIGEIRLTLHPATADETDRQYVMINLVVRMSDNYPDQVPEIVIESSRGLSDSQEVCLTEALSLHAKAQCGWPMLHALIETAKDTLTAGNVPHCPCSICLDHFIPDDDIHKTACYHYYHSDCLLEYMDYYRSHADEDAKAGSKLFPCPICREEIEVDVSVKKERKIRNANEIKFVPDPYIRAMQKKMQELYEKQKEKGGIIDIEEEKNKFLIQNGTVLVREDSQASIERGGDELIRREVKDEVKNEDAEVLESGNEFDNHESEAAKPDSFQNTKVEMSETASFQCTGSSDVANSFRCNGGSEGALSERNSRSEASEDRLNGQGPPKQRRNNRNIPRSPRGDGNVVRGGTKSDGNGVQGPSGEVNVFRGRRSNRNRNGGHDKSSNYDRMSEESRLENRFTRQECGGGTRNDGSGKDADASERARRNRRRHAGSNAAAGRIDLAGSEGGAVVAGDGLVRMNDDGGATQHHRQRSAVNERRHGESGGREPDGRPRQWRSRRPPPSHVDGGRFNGDRAATNEQYNSQALVNGQAAASLDHLNGQLQSNSRTNRYNQTNGRTRNERYQPEESCIARDGDTCRKPGQNTNPPREYRSHRAQPPPYSSRGRGFIPNPRDREVKPGARLFQQTRSASRLVDGAQGVVQSS